MPYDNPAEARRHGFIPGTYQRVSKGAGEKKRYNPAQGKNGSLDAGAGFNKQAAGTKTYGMGRAAPNMGKTSDKAGYGKRDTMNRNKARAGAIQKRLGGM